MKEYRVKLSSFDDVKKFVACTTKYPYSLHVVSGDKLTNAKSLIGFFTLDLSKPVALRVDQDGIDTTPLLQEIAEYLV